MNAQAAKPRNLGLLFGLAAVAVVMLCFGLFAMKPLYSVWCRLSGTQLSATMDDGSAGVLVDRYVTTYFEAVNFDDLPVKFWADQASQRVQIGAQVENTYHFENLSDKPVHFRPIHQVSPVQAGPQFVMLVCFCFTSQTVGPHETRSFPVIYRFKPDLDPRTSIITLRYGLFAIDPTKGDDPAEIKRQEERMGGGGIIVTPRKSSP